MFLLVCVGRHRRTPIANSTSPQKLGDWLSQIVPTTSPHACLHIPHSSSLDSGCGVAVACVPEADVDLHRRQVERAGTDELAEREGGIEGGYGDLIGVEQHHSGEIARLTARWKANPIEVSMAVPRLAVF